MKIEPTNIGKYMCKEAVQKYRRVENRIGSIKDRKVKGLNIYRRVLVLFVFPFKRKKQSIGKSFTIHDFIRILFSVNDLG
jgi:hypothetical protein